MKSYVRIKFEIFNCEYSLKACFEIVKSAVLFLGMKFQQNKLFLSKLHITYTGFSAEFLANKFCNFKITLFFTEP